MKAIYIYIIAALLIVAGAIYGISTISKLRSKCEILTENIYSLQISNDSIASRAASFQTNLETLKASKDSVDKQLVDAYKELNKKDRQIASLQYIAQEYNQRDTIKLTDTIFVKDVKIDTTIQDRYSKLNIKLEYPNTITTDYTVYNELDIVVSKETIYVGGRSKCFLKRWFQEKHKVMIMDVKNQNPHVITNKTRFYEVIK